MDTGNSVVLLVDDEVPVTESLRRSLERRDPALTVLTAHSVAAALDVVRTQHPHVTVLDLSLDPAVGPVSGLELISTLLSDDPTLRILVLTGNGDELTGIEAIQRGAASFISKPPIPEHLHALIRDGIEYSKLKRKARESITPADLFDALGLSTRSSAMREALNQALFAASNSLPTLLTGETGTGKGVLAQAIHRASPRHRGPFIRCQPNYGNPDLVSSELFGHERGAFTGAVDTRIGVIEAADRGTLFIDEVDELPHDTQVTLLNVLQERTFRRVGSLKERQSDFRLIVATNRPLESLADGAKLRTDLFHRIAHLTITLPPLRARQEDMVELAQEFLSQAAAREKLPDKRIAPDAAQLLSRHHWPGNVRELQAVMEGALHRAHFEQRNTIGSADIRLRGTPAQRSSSFRDQVDSFERRLIEEALSACSGNQSQAAERLQLDRSTLRRILARVNRP